MKANKSYGLGKVFLALALLGASTAALADSYTTTFNNQCKVYNPHPVSNETASWSGSCIDGLSEGFGTLTWYVNGKQTDVFVGNNKQGKALGQGSYTWPNGNRYVGEWQDGRLTGKGVMTLVSGSRYDGGFVDGKKHGLGKLVVTRADTDAAAWEQTRAGRWVGDNYVIQGRFADNMLMQPMTDIQLDAALAEAQ